MCIKSEDLKVFSKGGIPLLLKKFLSFKRKILIICILFLLNSVVFALNQLDLNTASLEDLIKIPGIGKVIAKNIIEYREKNGPFTSVDELLKVKGIGIKKLNQIKPYFTVSNSTSQSFSVYSNTSSPIYLYKDEKGILHYTQFPESVPPKYRKSLRKVD